MAIEENITVDAAGAVEQVDALASAFESLAAKAAGAVDKINASLSSVGEGGGAASAGADKLAASMEAAAAKIAEAADKAGASLGKIGESAAGAAGGVERLGGAADAAAGGLGDVSASADEAAAASSRLADASDAAAAAMDRQAVAGERAGKSSAVAAEAGASGFMRFAKAVTIGGGIAAAYGIDKAMKLNAEVTRLYTAAGLQGVKPADVTAAVLRIGTQTGFSGQAIAEAMYHPVSAGLNWQTTQGLTQQSANLANIHGANLDDTTYAMSSVMKGYNLGSGQVSKTAAELNSIVGQGDMRFQDFNESVKNWVPTAASMGISMQSMGAGLDYLTDRGNSAEVASTRLTMGLSMATAGSKAANVYMKDLGLTTGTLDLKNKSLQATMIAGGLTTNKFAADLKQPDGLYVALNDMQGAFTKAGLSGAQADTVMAKIFGGGRSDKAIVSLMQNLDGVRQKYDQIGQGVKNYQSDVAKEQATPEQKWKNLTAGLQNAATGFGTALLPAFSAAAGFADRILADVSSSGLGAKGLAVAFGGAAALFTGKKLVSGVESAFKTGETILSGVGKVAQTLNIPGLDKLAGLGSNAGTAGAAGMQKAGDTVAEGAGAMQRAADTMAGAAGAMQRAADTMAGTAGEAGLGGKLGAGEAAAGTAAGAEGAAAGAATAEGEAAAAGEGGMAAKLKGHAGTAALGLLIAPAVIDALENSKNPHAIGDTNPNSWFNSWQGTGHALGAILGLSGAPTATTASNPSAVRYGLAAPSLQAPPPPPPPAPTTLPAYRSTAGFRGTTSAAESAPIKAKVEVDLASVGAAKAKAVSELQGIGTGLKPAKLPEPDTSAIQAAKAKAISDISGINSALKAGSSSPVKIPEPDMSGLLTAKAKASSDMTSIVGSMRAAAGPAQAAGAAVSQGLAAGIASAGAAAIAAAQHVASAVAAAMSSALQTHSPSKVTEAIGADASLGVAVGLAKKTPAVKAAAISITESTVNTLVTGLQGGQTAIDAAMTALGQSTAKPQDIQAIEAATAKLKTDLSSALTKKIIGKPEDSALTQMLTADTAKLEGLAAKRDMLVTEITNSQQIATSVIGNASILNAASAVPTQSITAQSSQETVQGMQWQAEQAKEFAQQLQQLKKEGLNSTELSQLAQDGASAGMPVTEGLISGGKGAVSQLNQLQSQITSAAGQIGDVGGVASYQSGQQIAAQTGKGLKSQLASVDSEMKQLASGMVNAVKSAVGGAGLEAAMKAAGASAGQGFAAGIKSETSLVSAAASSLAAAAEAAAKAHLQAKSPSQLFAMIGASVPEGFVKGVTGGIPSVESAVMRMAQLAAAGAAGHPQPSFAPGWAVSHGGGGSGGSGGGGTPVTINVTLTLDGQQLATATQTVNLQRASNNWQSGLNYPYKAA